MKKKHPKALTATRVRYRVYDSYGFYRRYAKKEVAMRAAKKVSPSQVHDAMACIGSPQVWRVDETGIHLMRHRQT